MCGQSYIDHRTKEPHMSNTTEQSSGATAIRPFEVHVPDEDLADLRRRIAAARLPSKELVDDRSQGVQLATIQELARYWAEEAYPNLIHYNQLDKGGHFAAWEQPELFVSEVRAGLRSLR
jgi:hypothetical protein